MSAMKRLFQLMADKQASDIFLSVGAPINIKINGQAMPVNPQVMDAATVQNLLYEVLKKIGVLLPIPFRLKRGVRIAAAPARDAGTAAPFEGQRLANLHAVAAAEP